MTILWSINDRMGAAVPLEDKVVNLYYICDRGRFKADIQIQDGNVIVWDFPGIKQRYLGSYGLTVEILQSGGKRIIRKDIQEAFELVSASYMEKNDNGGANISDKAIITLSSELDIYRISPIVPEIGENNNWWVDGVDTGRPATIDKEELNKKQEVYVTEFDVASLLSAKYNNTVIRVDTQRLDEAIKQGKTIVVPVDNRYSGVCACAYYIEDGIYLSIFNIGSRIDVWIDFVPEIDPDNISILHTSDIPTKSEIPTKLSQLEKDIDFGEAYYITSFDKNLFDTEIPDDGKYHSIPCQEQGLTEAIKNKKSIRLLSSLFYPEIGYLESVKAETDDMNYLVFSDGVYVILVDFQLNGSAAEVSRRLLITKDNINANLESDVYYITSFDYQSILRGILNGDNRIQCYEPNLYQAVKDNKAIRLFVDMRYHDGYYEASSAVVDDFIYLTFENETSKFILDIVNDGSDLTFSIYDDTEIRQELTELSAEVSGLSEKIENLPSAESDVFKAVYGETSFAEIREAYDNGKVIHCDYKTQCYVLSRILETAAYFDALSAPNSYRITCSNDGWAETIYQLELKTNKVTSLSESSTDTQYPSAKAVYEALQNVGGGSSVFEAVYGVTTYDELVAAVKTKKHVICFYNNRVYNLCNYQENMDIFFSCVTSAVYTVSCAVANGKWSASQYNFENAAYKTTSLSSASTDTQYPSAKAVYEAIQQSGGGASNEWKCIYDGRMEVGANELVFSTYADGTPLKAEEVVVQVIMDNDTTKTTQAYVRVQSSTNKSETYYGAFFVENPNNNGFIAMSQVRLKASPFIMVAEMYDNLPLKVAQGVNCVGRLGKDVCQIYEDITLVRISTTTKIAEAAPLLKIYAR